MPRSVGDRLGPYEIVAPIGAGGMGEVYKARDTRLDRIVAIKVSREQFSEPTPRAGCVLERYPDCLSNGTLLDCPRAFVLAQ